MHIQYYISTYIYTYYTSSTCILYLAKVPTYLGRERSMAIYLQYDDPTISFIGDITYRQPEPWSGPARSEKKSGCCRLYVRAE